ncbi:hypothetical protein [Blastomonas sp. SL216]|uniref:hypothetical protein n=1 Tax=Blastomonas sp. SL216 TaxID=2995169 RepID=UPI0023776828|nr:hypothetical protein OU999_08645 [Blastomonas sp. SL216]
MAVAATSGIAIGRAAASTGVTSLALGDGASASNTNALAIGTSSIANGSGSTVVGVGARSAFNNTVAVGNDARAGAVTSIAIGSGSRANGNGAVIVGASAGLNTVTGSSSQIAIGSSSGQNVNGNNNVAMGLEAGQNIAGNGASGSGGNNNLALGTRSGRDISGSRNITLGWESGRAVSGNNNSALGPQSGNGVTGGFNSASGYYAGTNVQGSFNIASGNGAGADVSGNSNVAIGNRAGTTSTIVESPLDAQPIVITSAVLDVDDTVAIGSGAVATANSGTAIGDGARASGVNAFAGGTDSDASARDAVAIGTQATATGERSIALGYDAIATGSVAVGASARAGNGGAAFGDGAIATFNGGVNDPAIVAGTALGLNANSNVSGSTALGANSTVTVADGVALGSSSVAGTAAGVPGYVPLGASSASLAGIAATNSTGLGAVSVGASGNTRQITNVAAGAQDSDAVNVAQLKAVESLANAGWTVTDGTTGAKIGPNGTVRFAGDSNIKVSQSGSDGSGVVEVALSPDVDLTSAGSLTVGGSVVDAAGLLVSDGARTTSVGAGGVTSGQVVLSGVSNEVTGLGNRTLSDPTFATVGRAATEEQLAQVQAAATTRYFSVNDGGIQRGNYNNDGATGINSLAVGVNALADDADSVAVGSGARATGGNADDGAVAIGRVSTARGDGATAVGSETIANADGATAIGDDAKAMALFSTAIGDGASVNSTGAPGSFASAASIAIGAAANITNSTGSSVIGSGSGISGTTGSVILGAGNQITHADSSALGVAVIGGGNTSSNSSIVGVLGLRNSVSNSVDVQIMGDSNAVSSGRYVRVFGSNNQVVSSGDITVLGVSNNLTGAKDTSVIGNRNSVGENLTGSQIIASGATVSSDVSNVVAIGSGVGIAANRSTALGANSTVTVADGVALGSSSVAGTAAGVPGYVPLGASSASLAGIAATNSTGLGAVSVGASGNTRQITNVAAGAQDSDAVNVAQLKAVESLANAGWTVTDGTTGAKIGPNGTVRFAGDSNIKVSQSGSDGSGVVEVALSPDVDLTSAGSLTVGGSVVDAAGLLVSDGARTTSVGAGGVTSGQVVLSGVSNEVTGLGNRTLSDPTFATVGRAATEEQLAQVNQAANAGWTVTAQGANGTNVAVASATGSAVDLNNSDGNVVVSKSTGSNNVTFDLADAISVQSLTAGPVVIATTGINAGNLVISNVAAGVAGSDAVNVSQLSALGNSAASALGGGSAYNPATNAVTASLTVGTNNYTSVQDALTQLNSVAAAGWTVTDGTTGAKIGPNGTVRFAGDSNIKVSQSGSDGSGVVEVALSPDVDLTSAGSLTVGGSVVDAAGLLVSDGARTTSVGAGGVTSGQVVLSGVSNEVTGLGNRTLSDPTFATVGRAATEEQLAQVNQAANAGWTVTAQGANGTNVAVASATGSAVDLNNSDGNVVVSKSTGSNNVTFDLADAISVQSLTAGPVVIATTGINAGNLVISNVAAGVAGSDAVNVSQLSALGNSAASALGGGSAYNPATNAVTASLTVGTNNYTSVQDALTQLNSVAAAGWTVTDGTTGAKIGPNGTVRFAGDSNIKVSQSGSDGSGVVEVALSPDVDLTSAGSLTVGGSVVDAAGLLVSDGARTTSVGAGGVTSGQVVLSGVSNEVTGLGNRTLSDPTFATVGRAATEEQLAQVNQAANAGWTVTAQGANGTNVAVASATGSAVDLNNSDGNVVVSKSTGSNNVTFDLADAISVQSLTAGPVVIATTGINAGNLVISNVAAGVAGSDAVNVSQLSALGNSAASALGGGSAYNPATNAVTASLTVGTNNYTSVQDALTQLNSVAAAGWTVTDGTTGAKIGPNGTVRFAGDSNIKVSQSGSDGSGVVEVALSPDVDLTSAGSLTVGGSVVDAAGLLVSDGARTTSVGAGGVTSGQVVLSGVSNEVTGLGNRTLSDPTFATVGRAATEEQLAQVNQAANAGWTVTAQGANGTNVAVASATGSAVDLNNSDGNVVVSKSTGSNNVTFDLADAISVQSLTAGPVVIATTGINAGNLVISNVAAGVAGSDAVNVSQLSALGNSAASALGGGSAYNPATNAVTASLTVGTNNYTSVQDALTQLNSVAAAGWTVTDGTTGAKIGPNGTVRFAGDSNIKVSQSGSDGSGVVEVALSPDVDLTSAGSLTVGGSVVDAAGLLVSDGARTTSVGAGGVTSGQVVLSGVSNEVTGLGNRTLSDPTFATVGRAATEEQLAQVNQAANAGWTVTAQGANGTNVAVASATGSAVDLNNSDGNVVVSKSTGSNNVTFNLAENIKVVSLKAGNTSVDTNGIAISGGQNGAVVLSGSGLNNGGNKITNVAAGVAANDAVNVSQLQSAIGNVNIAFSGNAGSNITRSSGQVLAIRGTGSTIGTYSGGNIRTVTDSQSGSINIELADSPKFGNVTINAEGTGKITGVAAGSLSSKSSDAVNGSQIVALGDSIASSISPGSKYNPVNNAIEAAIVVGGNVYTNVESAIQAVNSSATAGWKVATASIGSGVATGSSVASVAPGSTATFTAGNNVMIKQSGTEVQIAVNPNITGVESLAIVGGATMSGNGIDMAGDRISNLGAGTAAGDAVNLDQLNNGLASTLGQANIYTDTAVSDLRFDLSRFGRDANGGTASAMAMGTVPQAFEPGMGIMGFGVAHWQGEQAFALGFSKASDDGRVILRASGTYNTRRQAGAAVGFGIQF